MSEDKYGLITEEMLYEAIHNHPNANDTAGMASDLNTQIDPVVRELVEVLEGACEIQEFMRQVNTSRFDKYNTALNERLNKAQAALNKFNQRLAGEKE